MKYLITSSASFIGHNITHILESQRHECIVDTNTSYEFIPQSKINYLSQHRSRHFASDVYPVDICDQSKLDSMIKLSRVNVVIHIASFPRQKVVKQDPITSRLKHSYVDYALRFFAHQEEWK